MKEITNKTPYRRPNSEKEDTGLSEEVVDGVIDVAVDVVVPDESDGIIEGLAEFIGALFDG